MIGSIFRNIFGCSLREREAQRNDEERARIFSRESSRMKVRVRTAERLVEAIKKDQINANY